MTEAAPKEPEAVDALAEPYRVEERNGWSYVVGNPIPEHSGPWRYQWEAQEYADELNQAGRTP
jgi:hypothetical protein